jgi:excisionase family DNA binding protein
VAASLRPYVTVRHRRRLQETQELQELQELHPTEPPMTATLLTARQVQELLDVDASTIYRMAGDGRIPAVRVGRQWRFPADAIDRLLVPGRQHTEPSPPKATTVPRRFATELLETIAPALGVSMVVTDLGGRPITPIVHPAPFIVDHLDDPEFTASCAQDWSGFAAEPHLVPRLQPGRFGFLCAHSFVRDGASLVAMVLAGGIAADPSEEPALFHLDDRGRERVLDALPRVAALLSRLVAGGDGPATDQLPTDT